MTGWPDRAAEEEQLMTVPPPGDRASRELTDDAKNLYSCST